MDMNAIGKLFEQAGLAGLPFAWGSDGTITFSESVTAEQKAAITQIIEDNK